MSKVYTVTAIIIGLTLALLFTRSENFARIPPTPPPTDLPQPLGPQGWGYRDPQATYKTLRWDQTRPALLMPNFTQHYPGWVLPRINSYPVEKKISPFGSCFRPPVIPVQQRPVAQSPYANWASQLRA